MVDFVKLHQNKLNRTIIFFNLTTLYQYLRQFIGKHNPKLVMFTSFMDQTIKEDIQAHITNLMDWCVL